MHCLRMFRFWDDVHEWVNAINAVSNLRLRFFHKNNKTNLYIITFFRIKLPTTKGLGSRRGEIGPAIEMHTDLKYVYMVYFIEKNRNFICLVLKL